MSDSISANRVEAPAEIVDHDQLIRVENGLLVVPSGCVLPPFCVKTNSPVTEQDMVSKDLTWCSPWIGLLFFISGPLLIIIYFVARKQCSITFGLSSEIRKRNSRRGFAKFAAMVAFLVATVGIATIDSNHWIISAAFPVTFLLFLVSVVALFVGNSPLSIVKHRNGMFWIKGLRPELIAQLPLEA